MDGDFFIPSGLESIMKKVTLRPHPAGYEFAYQDA
jgi:hypothetical protein